MISTSLVQQARAGRLHAPAVVALSLLLGAPVWAAVIAGSVMFVTVEVLHR